MRSITQNRLFPPFYFQHLDSSPATIAFLTTDKDVLQRYYNSTTYSDVCIHFHGHKIRAHRIVLASASEYFRAAFERGFKVPFSKM